jgi:hypothetical protein
MIKDNKKKNKIVKKTLSKLNSNNNYTIDEVIERSEKLNTSKLSMEYIKKELSDYYESFNKEKFANNSENTRESLEKFKLYKDKLFEIFKN